MLSVEQIAARLDDCFHLLTGGSRTALPRHQTLHATIDWSYALLSEPERTLLRRLSVFAGGWTLEAAEEVCAGDGLVEAEILDLLAGLASKSMVSVIEAPRGARRYTLLETIRQYGEGKLRQADEETGRRKQHVDYFLCFAETGDLKLHGPESLEWLHRMQEEYANLRVALEWCFGAGQAGEVGVKLTIALFEFWNKSSTYQEALIWQERAMQQSRSIPGTPARAKILYTYGVLVSSVLGKWEEGRPLLEESLEIWSALGASFRNDSAYVLIWLGYFLYHRDHSQSGCLYLQEAVDIFRETSDHWGLGWALNAFSELKLRDGDAETAFAMAEEGVAAFRVSGDRYGVAICIADLGDYNLRRGNFMEGMGYLEEALAIFREFGCKAFACQMLNLLGEIARMSNEYEKAEVYYGESLSMTQESGVGSHWLLSPSLNLGYTLLYLGDDWQAVSFYKQALNLSKLLEGELRIKRAFTDCLAGFAAVTAARGKAKAAARLYGAADAQYQALLPEGETIDSLIDLADRREFERYQAICCAQLGEAAYESAWVEGHSMTLEGALAEALAVSQDTQMV
jgi:tetratricopeptide (TPR) repeat protein